MSFILDETQEMLRDSAAGFLAERGGPRHLRMLRDSGDGQGFSRELWSGLAELGVAGILIEEQFGGLGLGHSEAGIVLEALGQTLTPSPFLASAVVASTILAGANDDLRKNWLPRLAAGEAIATLAIDESLKHRPQTMEFKAEKTGGGFRLLGKKRAVLFGHAADLIIVAARTSPDNGTKNITLFAVEKNLPGLVTEKLVFTDSSIVADLSFDKVAIGSDAVIGTVNEGWPILASALAAGRLGAAAELVGVAAASFAMMVTYLKQRQQFGRLIGEFQALQHRASHLYSEIEVARAVVRKAQLLCDEGSDEADVTIAAAKAKAGTASLLAVQEGVQMHGGIGMTDEHDIGLYMKRQRVLNEWFGDVNFQVNQVADLKGF